jgi:hypothetical protein
MSEQCPEWRRLCARFALIVTTKVVALLDYSF